MTAPLIESLGLASDGEEMRAVTLETPQGIRMRVLSLGGIVQSLIVPDANGGMADVVLGYDDPNAYLTDRFYLGALIGRFSNRIADGAFLLEGAPVRVTQNQGTTHLHGGHRGFNRVRWDMAPFSAPGVRGVVLTYTSADGEEGFPGTLATRVTYSLTDDGVWDVAYHAESDRPTVVNLTQHSYFNLGGAGSALDHEIRIAAARFLPQTEGQLPTGELLGVGGTPFDLRERRSLRDVLRAPELAATGLDHTFVLDQHAESATFAAELLDPISGRMLTVTSTAPSLHCYTSRFLENVPGKDGARYGPFDAVCLEAQGFPDAPNHAHFPSAVVRPGAPYTSRTRFAFTSVPPRARPT